MIALYSCTGCFHTLFPARKLCHRCGGAAWATLPCDRGVIEEVTIVRQSEAVPLASVRTPQGVCLIVRLEHAMSTGASVTLHEADGGALWARPVPTSGAGC